MPNPAEPHEFNVREGADTARLVSGIGFQSGQAIGGRYEVISRIGAGGMGLVYRVNQVFLKKEFALAISNQLRITCWSKEAPMTVTRSCCNKRYGDTDVMDVMDVMNVMDVMELKLRDANY